MENYQMFISGSSTPGYHAQDLHKNNTSFDEDGRGGGGLNLLMPSSRIESASSTVPRSLQVFGSKDHHQQQRLQFDPNYGGSGFSGPGMDPAAEKMGKKKVRRPRFAFQTRSQVDILDDGYRWRKYGQKAAKNNKFPRSYYRCTHQGCNVKKQVQRLTKDEGVVVTTYEGTHTHPVEKSTDNFEHILYQMQLYPLPLN